MVTVDQLLKKKPRKEGTWLAHYTGYSALASIVEHKVLRATNLHFLNDKSEFNHGYEVLKGACRLFFENAVPSNVLELFLTSFDENHRSISGINIHSLSFSEKSNLLSQWRGYTPKGGVSLRLGYADLVKIADQNELRLLPCLYDRMKKFRFATSYVSDFLVGKPHYTQITSENYASLSGEMARDFIQFAPLLKSEAFSEEAEWRMISSILPYPHKKVKFFASETMIKPYYEVDLKRQGKVSFPARITIGPFANKELLSKAMCPMFETHGWNLRETKLSQIPLISL